MQLMNELHVQPKHCCMGT